MVIFSSLRIHVVSITSRCFPKEKKAEQIMNPLRASFHTEKVILRHSLTLTHTHIANILSYFTSSYFLSVANDATESPLGG